jgi:DNA-binding MarR family transcriptional regulator
VHETNRQELAERLFRLTAHLARKSGTSAVALLDEVGVRPSQLRALHLLAFSAEPLTVSRLAELLGASQPTASRTAASLTKLGLATCAVGEADRRVREVSASDAGRDMIQRFAAARISDLGVFTEGLSEAAARRLSAALTQINLPLEDAQPAATGVAA